MAVDLPGGWPTPDAGPYWTAAAEDRFVLQQCTNCKTHRFVPRHICSECGSDEFTWVSASGDGVVHSFTVVHRAPTAEFRARAPYVVALIDLAEGPRMMANIIGDDANEVAIGDAVQVCFEERAGGGKVPQFMRAKAQTGRAGG